MITLQAVNRRRFRSSFNTKQILKSLELVNKHKSFIRLFIHKFNHLAVRLAPKQGNNIMAERKGMYKVVKSFNLIITGTDHLRRSLLHETH